MPRAFLLLNLGSPKSPEPSDVREYLNEFLMDPRVIDSPWLVRRLLVSAFILPFRPKRTAAAYRQIWLSEPPGSPLLKYSQALTREVGARTNAPVVLAMRYGSPSIRDAIDALPDDVDEIVVAPLYPQHADSTTTTSIDAVRELAANYTVTPLPAFHADARYLDAQAGLIANHLPTQFDRLLFSFHGLPERHLTRTDPTGSHCLASDDCCQRDSIAHLTCYRHQAFETSRQVATRLGLTDDRYTISFQSRLGRLPWLTPYTDAVLRELPDEGVRHLVVACPAFVADNLETLEEIGIQGRETFLSAGGETFTLVPCMNDDPAWADALTALLEET